MMRNLKEIELKEDTQIDFTQFKVFHNTLPTLYHPAFILQDKLREKV